MATNTKRIGKELLNFNKAGNTTIFLHAVEDNLMDLRALVIGPPDSPYDGGFLYFSITPDDYPNQPPKVKFLTPNSCKGCRMHPNLYAEGKVCLSILGTWGNWEWSPLLNFEKIFITIQGILNDNPIINEPGFEKLNLHDTTAKGYSINSRWLTLSTVLSMLERDDVPEPFKNVMKKYFVENFESVYVKSLKFLEQYNGQHFPTFHHHDIVIKFDQLFKKFEEMKLRLTRG
jgi:ubiquitin-protein ligase